MFAGLALALIYTAFVFIGAIGGLVFIQGMRAND